MTNQPKVLVYLFGSLGDTLVAIPALRAVRKHFRDAELVLLQNAPPANLVKASEVIPDDLIDRYLSYTNDLSGIRKLFGFYQLSRLLRLERFDSVVYLIISERPANSVLRDNLFFRLCGISDRIGFHAFSNEELYPVDDRGRPAMTDHEAIRKLSRLKRDGIKVDLDDSLQQPLITLSDSERSLMGNWLAEHRKKPHSRLVSIAPGCKTKAHVWRIENFIVIGQKLMAEHDCELVVVGGKAEVELGERMIEAWGSGINAAGAFSVRQSATLLASCDLHIGLNTGTTHLAAAVDTPCLGIYGERDNPGQWSPLGNGHSVVFHAVECSGCRLFDCPFADHPCMMGISVDSVWKNLQHFWSKDFDSKVANSKLISV